MGTGRVATNVEFRKVNDFIRLANRYVNEWGEAKLESSSPLTIHTPTKAPVDRWIFMRKSPALLVESLGQLPRQTGLVSTRALASKELIEFLVSMSARQRCRIRYLCDLDVIDLLAFLQLLTLADARKVTVELCGVTDTVLEALERTQLLVEASIPVTPSEARFTSRVLDAFPRLKPFLGERAVGLLKSGVKLELEGVLMPARSNSKMRGHLRKMTLHA